MPRNLTDLMERATSFAPPEPHAAADITSLAARRQRRRATGIAAGLAVAVLVVTAAGYGVTRHDSKPEPAAPYRYDQHLDLSDAAPASSLPGYRLQPWTLPSVQRFGSRTNPWPTYQDVDADGRLIVEDYPGGVRPIGQTPRVRLYDGPGEPPRDLQSPPSPGSEDGNQIVWLPVFSDGRLLWTYQNFTDTSKAGFHITDLSGGHDEFVHSGFTVGKTGFDGNPSPGRLAWVSGDRMWFLVYDHNLPHFQGSAFTLYTATFAGKLTQVAGNVADVAVGDGRVAWVTTNGRLSTESAAGGTPQTVRIPFDSGCHLPIQLMQSFSQEFAVSRSAISITEACGPQKSATYAVLAFDLSGRRLVHVAVPLASSVSIVGNSLLFIAGSNIQLFRYDFVTGSLATVGQPEVKQPRSEPQGAGDYLLWYDEDGGHVARIPQ